MWAALIITCHQVREGGGLGRRGDRVAIRTNLSPFVLSIICQKFVYLVLFSDIWCRLRYILHGGKVMRTVNTTTQVDTVRPHEVSPW